jgi:hypothetical protein
VPGAIVGIVVGDVVGHRIGENMASEEQARLERQSSCPKAPRP